MACREKDINDIKRCKRLKSGFLLSHAGAEPFLRGEMLMPKKENLQTISDSRSEIAVASFGNGPNGPNGLIPARVFRDRVGRFQSRGFHCTAIFCLIMAAGLRPVQVPGRICITPS